MKPNTRKFRITGLKPFYNKKTNEFIAACGLGVTGTFIDFSEITIITIAPSTTQEQLRKQPKVIKETYEKSGCIDIKITEYKN